jgi:DinB family protein
VHHLKQAGAGIAELRPPGYRVVQVARKETAVLILAAHDPEIKPGPSREDLSCQRAQELADRLEQGAQALAQLAAALTDAQWQIRIPRDGRTIGVLVHHVASVYPLEIQLAQAVATGQPVTCVTMDDVNEMNATHARMYDGVTKEAALDLLRRNSAAAAAAIRVMNDEQLDRAALVSLYGNAPLTCQFVLEDRAVRHSYHHLASIQKALQAHDEALERLKDQLEACVDSKGPNCRPELVRRGSVQPA